MSALPIDFYLAEIFDFGRLLKEVIFQNNATEWYLWNYVHSIPKKLTLLYCDKSLSRQVSKSRFAKYLDPGGSAAEIIIVKE